MDQVNSRVGIDGSLGRSEDMSFQVLLESIYKGSGACSRQFP